LASALFANDSPLFTTKSEPDSTTDISNTSPANPTLASKSSTNPEVDQELAKSFARSLEVPLGVTLEKVSLKWAGWEGATNFAGSDAAPDGGYEALVEKVFKEAEAKGAELKLSTAVKGIKENENGDRVIVETEGESYEGKTIICTIPLGVLKTLPDAFFTPSLPGQMKESIAGTHVGVLEKLLLNYPSAWWPNHDSVGSYTFLPTGPAPTDSSSLEQIFEGSTLTAANFACPTLPGPNPTLLTYISETPARLLLQHPVEQVAEAYHMYLVKRFGAGVDVPKPSDYSLTNWLTDPLSRGATTTPSIVSENGERSPMDFKELSRPVWGGKLGFAGEHTEMEHRGSVAGAVVSGQREAARVGRFLDLASQA
jgi:lysine-specific histone demethylase 1B